MLNNLQAQHLLTNTLDTYTPYNQTTYNQTTYNQTASIPPHPPSLPHITKKLHMQLRMQFNKIAPMNKNPHPLLHTPTEQTGGDLKSSSQNRLTPEELNPFNPLRVAPLLSHRKQDHNVHEQGKPHDSHHHPSHPIAPFVEFDTLDWQPAKTPKKSLPPESEVYSARVPNEPLSALRGVTLLNLSEEALIAFLEDISSYTTWMDGITRIVPMSPPKDASASSKHYVSIADAHWPFSPRYDIVHQQTACINQNTVQYTARSDKGRTLPPQLTASDQPTMERLQYTDSSFTVERLNAHQVRFTFDIHIKADKQVNPWFLKNINPWIPTLMTRSITHLRAELTKRGLIEE